MKEYGLNELREMFLSFFESKGHLRLDSFSLIPYNDKSLLLINSGMAPLKPYFTGQETPPQKRVTTCQKCIRTPDIENVGKTARHGTFFEMLGNFSFGDYFKEEAIAWAWEFLTEVVGFSEDVLYVTVYEEDDEAFSIWENQIGVPKEKIVRMGKEDNFWEIGLGPCGPCSEIYVDRGEKFGCGEDGCYVGCDCDRYVEVWNLVFTQYDKDEDGNYNLLKHPNIDTGMGLERLAAAVQDADNLFEVDTVKYVLNYICSLANVTYQKDAKKDISIRVITDHIRSVVFMLSDGIIPSNEGRGYVLRRLLRRAVRHGKLLGIDDLFMVDVAKKVIETSKDAYASLDKNKDSILKTIEIEEINFNTTIAQGSDLIKQIITQTKKEKSEHISGDDAFKLYDTYGFPLELTIEIAEEENLSVDVEGFNTAMEKQKQMSAEAHRKKSAAGWKDDLTQIVSQLETTIFTGYDQLSDRSEVVCLIKDNESVDTVKVGDTCIMICAQTPFYAQSGGQVGDIGTTENEHFKAKVTDVTKSGDKFIHDLLVTEGQLSVGDLVDLYVDETHRMDVQRNHTATHLLHKALKSVLGNHVNQAGSEVTSEKLRFDFSHFEKVTDAQLAQAEAMVNEEILKGTDVVYFYADIDEAKDMGATALFGEKYTKEVRVVKIGDFSMELCGGCHLENISNIGLFKIISESSVAAGVRRIEAVTGRQAYQEVTSMQRLLNEAADVARTTPKLLTQKLSDMTQTISNQNKELSEIKQQISANVAGDLVSSKLNINGIETIIQYIDNNDMNSLRTLSDELRETIGSGIVVLSSFSDEKGSLIISATKDIVTNGFSSNDLIKKMADKIGIRGGGRPDMAQAGLKDIQQAKSSIEIAKQILEEIL